MLFLLLLLLVCLFVVGFLLVLDVAAMMMDAELGDDDNKGTGTMQDE